ncbi:MAG: transporter substrate-binding domain-containing protein [Rhizobiaceae bacterium]
MKILKSILAASVFAAGLGITAASAELRLGLDTSPYPPFADVDASGKRLGFEIELGEAICKVMKEKCVWTPIAWDGIIPALQSKKIDAIFASMSITEKRMKVISFSNKYYNTPAALVAAKDSAITKDLNSLKGKIVAAQVSTTHADYANKHIKSIAGEIKTYPAFDEHNNDLVAGRVDAVVGDSLAFDAFFKSEQGKKFEIKGFLADDAIFGAGAGVGLRKEDKELREKFNKAIAQVLEDGTYDDIAKKYFNFDIYGK